MCHMLMSGPAQCDTYRGQVGTFVYLWMTRIIYDQWFSTAVASLQDDDLHFHQCNRSSKIQKSDVKSTK